MNLDKLKELANEMELEMIFCQKLIALNHYGIYGDDPKRRYEELRQHLYQINFTIQGLQVHILVLESCFTLDSIARED